MAVVVVVDARGGIATGCRTAMVLVCPLVTCDWLIYLKASKQYERER